MDITTSEEDVISSLRSNFTVDWRQQDAIDRVKSRTKNTRVLAFENRRFKNGCRKFVTADIQRFYDWYRRCFAPRHFYEIILEGIPCRLYFDLEYYYEFNSSLDSKQMLDDFLRITTNVIMELFTLKLDARNFLILDSSNDEKFSLHVIVHLPDRRLFPNNISLKSVINHISSRLFKENLCIVKTSNGETVLCDLQVYTKNRNFRLYLSNKFGKTSILKMYKNCVFYGDQHPSNYKIFFDSLVIPKDYEFYELLDLSTVPDIRVNLQRPVQNALDKQFPAAILTTNSNTKNRQPQTISQPANNGIITDLAGGACGTSPFPMLDAFMLGVFQNLKKEAKIRVWRFVRCEIEDKPKLFNMQYQLTNCRYCYNKKREHRSQNVYWVVDFHMFCYFQRCFDKVDCPQFISPMFALPEEICLHIMDKIDTFLNSLHIPPSNYRPLPGIERFKAESVSFSSPTYDRLFQKILRSTPQSTIKGRKNQTSMDTPILSTRAINNQDNENSIYNVSDLFIPFDESDLAIVLKSGGDQSIIEETNTDIQESDKPVSTLD